MGQIIVRCGAENCGLRQYKTVDNRCRKCRSVLPEVVTAAYGDEIPEEPKPVFKTVVPTLPPDGKGIESGLRSAGFGSIAAKFKARRLKAGLTQQQMADGMGIPRTYASRIENGRLIPGPEMLEKCARFMGVPITAILPGDPLAEEITAIFLTLGLEGQRDLLDIVKEMNTNDTTA